MEKRAHLKRQRQASTPSDIDGELADALASATSRTTTRRRRVSSTSTSTRRTATRARTRTLSTRQRTRTRTANASTLRSSESAQSAPSLSDISSQTAASSSASHAPSSSSGLPSGAKAAVIAVSVGVGSVIILAILFFCLRKRRKPPRSQGPSPMMISLDSAFDEKSFVGGYKDGDFAPAINHYDGRPLSFLDNIHSTLRSQDRHFENVTHPESQAGSHARSVASIGLVHPTDPLASQSQEDPFRFGSGQGAAFTNDVGRHQTPAQPQFPPQHPPPPPQEPTREVEELLDAYQRPISSHPYALPSETSFSRNKSVKSVKFSDDRPAHPFALTNPDVPQSPPQHPY